MDEFIELTDYFDNSPLLIRKEEIILITIDNCWDDEDVDVPANKKTDRRVHVYVFSPDHCWVVTECYNDVKERMFSYA